MKTLQQYVPLRSGLRFLSDCFFSSFIFFSFFLLSVGVLRAHLNGERYMEVNFLISMNFNLISKKRRVCVLSGNIVLVADQKIIRKKRTASHNAQPTNNDARRRERRFALPRARRRQPLFLFGRAG